MKLNLLLKLSYLHLNFALTLGYLYPMIKELNLLQKPENPAGYKRWISRKRDLIS